MKAPSIYFSLKMWVKRTAVNQRQHYSWLLREWSLPFQPPQEKSM